MAVVGAVAGVREQEVRKKRGKDPDVDLTRILAAAIAAALDEHEHAEPVRRRRGLSGMRGIATGAAVAVVARAAVSKLPPLSELNLPELAADMRERVANLVDFDDEEPPPPPQRRRTRAAAR